MSKAVKQTESEAKELEANAVAYSLVRKTGEHAVIEIKFNKDQLVPLEVNSIYSDPDYSVVEEKFRILVANNIFIPKE